MTVGEIQPSVAYRENPPTVEDYAEAVELLTFAMRGLAGELSESRGCLCCGDSGHTAATCHHNPLLLARAFAVYRDRNYWRCFHCGDVFALGQEELARDHFGKGEDEAAACIRAQAEEVAEAVREHQDDLDRRARAERVELDPP